MGVDGLLQCLRKLTPLAFRTSTLAEFAGKRMAIDASLVLHLNSYGLAEVCMEESSEINMEKLKTLWETRSLKQLAGFIESGITPVYVFDGKATSLKSGTITARKEQTQNQKHKLVQMIQNLEVIEKTGMVKDSIVQRSNINKQIARTFKLPYDFVKDFQKTLHNIGIPVWKAKQEADQLMAAMYLEGIVDVIYSSDSDLLIDGCDLLRQKSENNERTYELICYKTVIETLGLTRDMFVEWAIRCGTDYNKREPNVGPMRSLEKVRSGEQLGDIFNGISVSEIKKLFSYVPSDTLLENFPRYRIDEEYWNTGIYSLYITRRTELEKAKKNLINPPSEWISRDIE